jgi:lipid-A-disaccharide synthase
MRAITRFATAERPDVVVPFSCRTFTLIVLKRIRGPHIPTAWVYPPGDWVQDEPPEPQVVRAADLFACAYEWQAQRFERAGARVVRVPHHSLLPLPAPPPDALAALRPDASAGPTVALFPGSRPDEVSRLVPLMAEALRLLASQYPRLHAVFSHASGVPESEVASRLSGLPCTRVISALPVRILAEQADVAVACCGTASTEVAVAGCPQVVVYKPAWLTAKVMQLRGRREGIRFLSMTNLGLGRRVVPELLHNACRPDLIAAEVSRLLRDSQAAAAMRESYAELRAAMGHGSWDDAADAIVALAREPSQ